MLLPAMLLAVAAASLIQASVLWGPVPIDFMARYAGGRLADHGHSPYDRATLFAVEQELVAGVDEMPF